MHAVILKPTGILRKNVNKDTVAMKASVTGWSGNAPNKIYPSHCTNKTCNLSCQVAQPIK